MPISSFLRWCTGAGLGALCAGFVGAQTDGSQRWAFSTLSSASAGSIVSSPAVAADGTVYVGVQVGASNSATPSGRVFALTPAGAQKWVFTTPDWVDAAPAIGADGTIYVGCWNGVLYALRPDGSKRWEYKAGAFIASSPAIGADGTIYVGAASNLIAINPDGTFKWIFPAGDWIDSSPAIAPDGTILVGSWDDKLYAVRPDGTEKWQFETGGDIASSPAVAADGTVYFASRDASVYSLTAEGTLRWSFDTRETLDASPALAADGTVYQPTTGGRMLALTRDGAERWRYPRADQPALNALYSSPAVRSDGAIIFGSSNNAIYALKSDGTLLWRTTLGDWSDASPAIASGVIYLASLDKKLYAFNSTGELAATDWPQFRRDGLRTGRSPAAVPPPPPPLAGRLINLSVRTMAGAGSNTLIVGFVVGGAGGRSLLVRGVGPALSGFNVAGALEDPRIELFAGNVPMATNDDWGQAANAAAIVTTASSVGAFPLPANSRDAAALGSFNVGGFTVQVTGSNGASGVALMEMYDTGGASTARLANVSARSAVGTGADILITGFVVQDGTCTILVRAIGPSLSAFGVSGVLADPVLRIYRDTQQVAENNDWSIASNATTLASTAQAVGAFALPAGSLDAALLVTLQPGAYTAQISGVGGATGVGLVEVYEVR